MSVASAHTPCKQHHNDTAGRSKNDSKDNGISSNDTHYDDNSPSTPLFCQVLSDNHPENNKIIIVRLLVTETTDEQTSQQVNNRAFLVQSGPQYSYCIKLVGQGLDAWEIDRHANDNADDCPVEPTC